MSSILLLLEDGEMHPFVSGQQNPGNIVLTRHPSGSNNAGEVQFSDAVMTTAVGAGEHHGGGLSLGSHFLTTSDGAGGEHVIKVENMSGMGPVEVVLDRKGKGKGKGKMSSSSGGQLNTSSSSGAGGNLATSGEKKVCLWPMGNGTTCGKTFTKFDSLKRHLSEAHKGEQI
jgi:hypothetical protein